MDDLDRKIHDSIGRHWRHHFSNVEQVPNSSTPILKRPGRRGYFTMNTVTPESPSEQFKVFHDGACLGVMEFRAIQQKFGRV